MKKPLTAKQLAEHLKTSRPTISRWVQRGCPVEIMPGYKCKQLFDLKKVEDWLSRELTNESATVPVAFRLKSRRRLKKYFLFSSSGHYLETIEGSRSLVEQLQKLPLSDHHRPYGIDETGTIYFIYSGKLRKHDSVKSTLAGVLIQHNPIEKLKSLFYIVHERYLKR